MQAQTTKKGGEIGSLEKMVGVGGASAEGVRQGANLHVVDGGADRIFRTNGHAWSHELHKSSGLDPVLL